LTQFTDFGLASPVLRALEEAGYTVPTPIQAQAIPPAMAGRDLCGIAQTGTGKTAAFALPILHRLSLEDRRPPRRGCRVLVLSPTRELANQIADSFSDYGKHLRTRWCSAASPSAARSGRWRRAWTSSSPRRAG
jgi:ATP-dependent RNA helicase RhlE